MGSVHFLTCLYFQGSEVYRYDLRDKPARSTHGQPMLDGICGNFKDVSLEACGLVRVTRVCKNGRAYVRVLEGAELYTSLDALGYPDLAAETDEVDYLAPLFQILDAMGVIERTGVLDLPDEFRDPAQVEAVRDYAEMAFAMDAPTNYIVPVRLTKIAARYTDELNPSSCYH